MKGQNRMTEAATQTQPTLTEPPVTGRKYAPIAELGRGGMATAFLSVIRGPRGFNKMCVVKRLRPALAAEPEFLRMFLDEARLAARIDHPNVVQTFEVGVDADDCFIAMEFVDGQPFEHVVRRAQRVAAGSSSVEAVDSAPGVPLNLGLHVIGQVLDALHFAHTLKDFDGTPLSVVHRDVSPHNVMVTYEGHVKLLDFGIAKAADSTTDTRTGVIKGKCGYMAPEQFGGVSVDRRADVFGVGVMLWQAMTGRRMWRGLSDVEIFQHLAKGDLPLPSAHRPDVDPALEAICMKALAPAVSDRFETAADFRSELDEYLEGHPELRATSRELGRYLNQLFEADRAKIHALIEKQVAENANDELDDLMNLSEYFGNSGTRPAAAVAEAPLSQPPPPALTPRRWRFLAVAGAAVVFSAALATTIELRKRVDKTPAAEATELESRALVIVRVSPADASVTLDNTPLLGSPPSGVFGRDGQRHRVTAAKPGYVPVNEIVILDSERVAMDVTLDASPPTEASQSSPVAQTPPSPRGAKAWRSIRHSVVPSASEPPLAPEVVPAPPPTATAAPPVAASAAPPAATSNPKYPALDQTDPWASRAKR